MTNWQIALKSLTFYLRTNLAIALGVAAATAVLTGALIVGDSMRHSLRSLTFERLGQIDEMVVSEGFFQEKLADDIQQTEFFKSNYKSVTPAIMFPGGTVQYETGDVVRRAGRVTVLGIKDEFWTFDSSEANDRPDLVGDTCLLYTSPSPRDS